MILTLSGADVRARHVCIREFDVILIFSGHFLRQLNFTTVSSAAQMEGVYCSSCLLVHPKTLFRSVTRTEGESETARSERLLDFFFFRYKKFINLKKLITSGGIFYIIGWLFSRTAATKWCSNTLLKWFLHNRSPLIYGCRRAHFGLPHFFTFVWRPLVFLRPRQLPMSPMPRAGPGCARIVKQFAEKNNNLDVLGDYFSIMIVLLLISDYHGQLKSLNWFVY